MWFLQGECHCFVTFSMLLLSLPALLLELDEVQSSLLGVASTDVLVCVHLSLKNIFMEVLNVLLMGELDCRKNDERELSVHPDLHYH